jgi:hypothetical protein
MADCSNAWFTRNGTRTAITLETFTPPDPRHMSAALRTRTAEAVGAFAAAAHRLGLRAWLAFMPGKRRVLDGYLEAGAGQTLPPLPAGTAKLVEDIARGAGMRFVDLTPGLRAEVAAGRLPFETWDSHLSRDGSHRVARTLAAALAPVIQEP